MWGSGLDLEGIATSQAPLSNTHDLISAQYLTFCFQKPRSQSQLTPLHLNQELGAETFYG